MKKQEEQFAVAVGEIEKIRQVINIAKEIGFGNLIAALRYEWATCLMSKIPKMKRKDADEATINDPYTYKFW